MSTHKISQGGWEAFHTQWIPSSTDSGKDPFWNSTQTHT